MKVRSVPSMPCGWKTRWSRTQIESNPRRSASWTPSMSRSWSASSPKWGRRRPKRVMSRLLWQSEGSSGGARLAAPARGARDGTVLVDDGPADQRRLDDATHLASGVGGPADLAEDDVVGDVEDPVEVHDGDVGVRADLEPALARQPEGPGGRGRDELDDPLQADPSGHGCVEEQGD